MNDIRIFEKPEFGSIRTVVDEKGEPWFCLIDVAKVLGLTRQAITQRLEKGVSSTYTLETSGGKQNIQFLSEDGLYDAIFDSRKPEAKAFRKWVTKEVLPSIRKTGEYSVKNGYDNPAWKATRLDGINFRRTLTDAIRDSGENERMHGHAYSQYTDMAYKMALGMNAKQYKKLKGLANGDNLRDNLDEAALHKVKIVEDALQFLLTLGYAYQEIKQIYDCKKLN